jgi:hypothetical protein
MNILNPTKQRPQAILENQIKGVNEGVKAIDTKTGEYFTELEDKAAAINDDYQRALEAEPPQRREAARAYLEQKRDSELKALRKNSEGERYKRVRELMDSNETLHDARQFYSNPLNMATTHKAGTDERFRADASVANLFPAQITAMRQVVEATGDKVLGAALIQKNNTLPANARPFVSGELAERLFGDDVRRVKGMIKEVERIGNDALNRNRAFEGKFQSGHQMISAGLNDPEAKIYPANRSSTSRASHQSSLGKISQGLDQL